MKSILYVVAIVLSCAAGYFSYSNSSKQEDQLKQTTDLNKQNATLQANIKKAKDDTKAEDGLLKDATEGYSTAVASLETGNSNVTNTNRSLGAIKNEVATLDEELDKIKAAQKAVTEAFGKNINLDEIPEYVEKLENERKTLAKEYEELSAASEVLTGQVTKNRESIGELERRAADRSASLRGNAAASVITSVNNSWGFVLIKPHPEASITEESKLIVVRGTQHVGRLRINSIEPGRVIADIDYDSLAPGVRIQPGDKVILGVSNTR